MARLEYIEFNPWRDTHQLGTVSWEADKLARRIEKLPQIYWRSGEGWAEANHWTLERAHSARSKPDTVKALAKHLHAYACFLEEHELDWRHFPQRLAERAVVRFRGRLIEQIDKGQLASSTARARISAVVQFYRHAHAHGFIATGSKLWNEKLVVMQHYDTVGFKRAIARVTTDLAIPNRRRPGVHLEEGLLPLSESHMTQLLTYTSTEESREIHLMLTLGFFTGARLATISSLRIENLEQAAPDPFMSGFFLMRVGPGTGVATKFNVEGDLLVPDFLLTALKEYAYSTRRLKREVRALPKDRSTLFLTTRSRPYGGGSVSRLMTDLRRETTRAELHFMARFKFHQTRATYGTWLMEIAVGVTTVAAAIELVKSAMLHKHESTTFSYIRFLEGAKGKQMAGRAFSEAFTGISKRSWIAFDA